LHLSILQKHKDIIDKNRSGKRCQRVVGLGIEKSFSSGPINGNVIEKVAVLKLCADDFCLNVHLLHLKKIPTSLYKFLDLSDITVVGLGIKQNLCDLQRDHGIQCRNVVVELADLVSAVKAQSTVSFGTLVDFYEHFICYPLSTSLTKSADVAFGDWGSSLLSKKQIFYASNEVCATIVVAKQLYSRRWFL
jgi:hypothetical protein